MGFLAWFTIGCIVAAAVHAAGPTRLAPRGAPTFVAATLGAVIGGFVADVMLRGDSVMNFHGPTAIGALAGAIVMIGLFSLGTWGSDDRRSI